MVNQVIEAGRSGAQESAKGGLLHESELPDGRTIVFERAVDTDLQQIEPGNPIHDRVIVTVGAVQGGFNWQDVLLFGQGDANFGMGRMYQAFKEAPDTLAVFRELYEETSTVS